MILQTVLVAVSVVVVGFQLRDARTVRQETSRPYVVVDLGTHGERIDLVIRNIGPTAATDVRVKFDPPPVSDSDVLGEVVEMLETEGIPFLAPGRELRFYYGVAGRAFREGYTLRFDASPSYQRADGLGGTKRIEDPPNVIDLFRIRHAQLAIPAADKAVRQLNGLVEAVERLSREVRRIGDAARQQEDPR